MAKNILVKPIITEKSEIISEKDNRYSFVVNKKANKIEIKNAVEEMYGVAVVAVNTAIMPAKTKSRNTKG
ncbi:MAG: large subunit ribosomal protein L23, partial [Maribacter sp.]